MLVNQLCSMRLQIQTKPKLKIFLCTIDPNIGIVPLKDERLDKLSEISKSEKNIYNCNICGHCRSRRRCLKR